MTSAWPCRPQRCQVAPSHCAPPAATPAPCRDFRGWHGAARPPGHRGVPSRSPPPPPFSGKPSAAVRADGTCVRLYIAAGPTGSDASERVTQPSDARPHSLCTAPLLGAGGCVPPQCPLHVQEMGLWGLQGVFVCSGCSWRSSTRSCAARWHMRVLPLCVHVCECACVYMHVLSMHVSVHACACIP